MENPWSGKTPDELVPTVDPADVKAVWQLHRETAASLPGEQVAIAIGVIESVCSPGADVHSVNYRATMLELLFYVVEQTPNELEGKAVAKWKHGDELDNALFKVMATIPLRWIPEGGMQGFPFDGPDFIKRVEQEVA